MRLQDGSMRQLPTYPFFPLSIRHSLRCSSESVTAARYSTCIPPTTRTPSGTSSPCSPWTMPSPATCATTQWRAWRTRRLRMACGRTCFSTRRRRIHARREQCRTAHPSRRCATAQSWTMSSTRQPSRTHPLRKRRRSSPSRCRPCGRPMRQTPSQSPLGPSTQLRKTTSLPSTTLRRTPSADTVRNTATSGRASTATRSPSEPVPSRVLSCSLAAATPGVPW
mmetsp:Transcript_9120/g.37611  ORF Transcript_9120/g.37611 Transcript_9120/m.37611 type:complete len:223 (-) Transcript_9120:605-1273(-)